MEKTLNQELISILQSEKDKLKNWYPRKPWMIEKVLSIRKEIDELRNENYPEL